MNEQNKPRVCSECGHAEPRHWFRCVGNARGVYKWLPADTAEAAAKSDLPESYRNALSRFNGDTRAASTAAAIEWIAGKR